MFPHIFHLPVFCLTPLWPLLRRLPLPISCPSTGLCKCGQGWGGGGVGTGREGGAKEWVGSVGSVMREQPECLWSLSEQRLNIAAPISFDPEGIVCRPRTGIAPSPADSDGHTYTQTYKRGKSHTHTHTQASLHVEHHFHLFCRSVHLWISLAPYSVSYSRLSTEVFISGASWQTGHVFNDNLLYQSWESMLKGRPSQGHASDLLWSESLTKRDEKLPKYCLMCAVHVNFSS